MNDVSKAHNATVNGNRPAMNLVKLFEMYGDEDRARQCLEKLRWPLGVRCLRCDSEKVSSIQSVTKFRTGPKRGQVRGRRHQYDCSCGYQFSVTTGTVLHDTHLPLWKWLLATYLVTDAKKGVSANQLKRGLGVSYEAAWYLCHRIRSAMVEANPTMLSGTVEADETYVGGKMRRGSNQTRQEAALRRLDNKTVVMGAVERGGKLRVRAVPDNGQASVHGFLRGVMDDSATALYTDAHRSYRAFDRKRHSYVDHSAEEWVRGDVHTNTIESAWSLFDRAVIGSYHKLSKKHLPAYLQEFEFRFNNRDNPYLFRDTLLALLNADALPYRALVHAVGPS